MQPLVSVIIPVFNAESNLRKTLDSVCNQTYENLEIICIDDGSTDDSLSILHEYEKIDKRFIILSQKNQYAGVARNYGLSVATGKYLSFLDSDDLFEPDMLEIMVRHAEYYRSEVVLCKSDMFSKEGEYVKMPNQLRLDFLPENVDINDFSVARDIPHASFQFFVGWAWDRLFRAEYIKTHNFKFGTMRHSEDAVLAYPASICAQHIGIVVPERCLVHYRQSATQTSSPKGMMTAPLSFFQAAEDIKNKLKEFELDDKVYMSLNCWFADYSAYTMFIMEGRAREEFIGYIKKEFEPVHDVVGKLYSIGESLLYEPVLKYYRHQIAQYCELFGGGKREMKFSCIVIFDDKTQYNKRCISSLLGQTYKNFEIICVRLASANERAWNDIYSYTEHCDKLKVLEQGGADVAAALNAGIEVMSGDWLLALGANDFVDSDFLEQCALDISPFKSKIVNFGYNWDRSHLLLPSIVQPQSLSIYGELEITSTLVGKTDSSVWNKLWHKSIFRDACIHFEEGMEFSDSLFYFSVLPGLSCMQYLPWCKYHRFMSEDNNTKEYVKDDVLSSHAALLLQFYKAKNYVGQVEWCARMFLSDLYKRVLSKLSADCYDKVWQDMRKAASILNVRPDGISHPLFSLQYALSPQEYLRISSSYVDRDDYCILERKVQNLESLSQQLASKSDLSVALHYERAKRRYRFLKINSLFCWGRRRKIYKSEKRKLREILRTCRVVVKKYWAVLFGDRL